MNDRANHKADGRMLTCVSETALMTLYGRAHQAGQPEPIIDDPMAVSLIDSIDFDFEKLGRRGQEMVSRRQMFFDLPPTIVKRSRERVRVRPGIPVPPMPFSVSARQLANLADTMPGVRAVHDVPMPRGRGLFFWDPVSRALELRTDEAVRGADTVLEFG